MTMQAEIDQAIAEIRTEKAPEAVLEIYRYAWPDQWRQILQDHITNGNDWYKVRVAKTHRYKTSKGGINPWRTEEIPMEKAPEDPNPQYLLFNQKQMSNRKKQQDVQPNISGKGAMAKTKYDPNAEIEEMPEHLRTYMAFALGDHKPNLTHAEFNGLLDWILKQVEPKLIKKVQEAEAKHKENRIPDNMKNWAKTRQEHFKFIYSISKLREVVDFKYGGNQTTLFAGQEQFK